jgi:hypothetical protein
VTTPMEAMTYSDILFVAVLRDRAYCLVDPPEIVEARAKESGNDER